MIGDQIERTEEEIRETNKVIADTLINNLTSLLGGTLTTRLHVDSRGKTWKSITIEYTDEL